MKALKAACQASDKQRDQWKQRSEEARKELETLKTSKRQGEDDEKEVRQWRSRDNACCAQCPFPHNSNLTPNTQPAESGQGGGGPADPLQILGVTGRGIELIVHFNKPVEPLSVDPLLFRIFDGPQQLQVQDAFPGPGGDVVILQLDPLTPLPEFVFLVLNANGITDLGGIPMEPAEVLFQAPTLNMLETCPLTDVQLSINCSA